MYSIQEIFNFSKNIDEILKIYKPFEGYIYCMHNKMYNYDGNENYKCGCTNNPKARIDNFVTPYIDKTNYVFISAKLFDKNLAETLLFFYLRDYRVTQNREFFNCNNKIIIKAIKKVEKIFCKYDNTIKMIEFLLYEYNYKLFFSLNPIILSSLSIEKLYNINKKVVCHNLVVSIENRINIKKIIMERKKIININDFDDHIDKYINTICDEQEFIKYLCKKYLNFDKELFNKEVLSSSKNMFFNIYNHDDFINKINMLFFFQNLLCFENNAIEKSKIVNYEEYIDKIISYPLFIENENYKIKIKKINNFKLLIFFIVECFNFILDDKNDIQNIYSKIINYNRPQYIKNWFNANYTQTDKK